MTDLASKSCEACNELTPKIRYDIAITMANKLNGWDVLSDGRYYLSKRWNFKNFAEPLKLVIAISELAEKEGHHPNISFGWGYVEVKIWTHAINGLSYNDFILAAKIDTLKV